MTRTVWLASYPKSGNTWFRMLSANLLVAGDEAADINALPERGGIASARGPFDYLTLIDSGLLTHDEIDRLRPGVYAALARGAEDQLESDTPADEVRLVKVHDAYTRNADGVPLLAGSAGAAGAIVIVRDPRAVAPSLASHLGVGIDAAIDFMADLDASFCQGRRSQPLQLRQKLAGWSGHVESWLDQRDLPVHLVRYEDLRADPVCVFAAALAFAGRKVEDDRIERAVRLADFANLRAQEQAKGFREAGRQPAFFRRGEAEGWRAELSLAQVARIERDHARVMARLGYRPAAIGAAGERVSSAEEATIEP
jgi:hypothetical protein